ncbi:Bug family tripartite tricarboxylate transporter substrate binding protein [Falsiroseomonas tokyonensis]|uniref:Bug family tripartite tricarboxylate transporter substrate binding protein n=1 Tax=Falsiroseomonas tokyonensis TaxID=430521 RepID=A0ABV7BUN3_9PROT|nr:tripartite tricarboxylate transporter substrate binding protein [Falsiroseomonas tokyonensis]MBU8537782.1 tripartite tricarboxylate transporter substrate binding protein [Falsiroseomonas tokyonensis]
MQRRHLLAALAAPALAPGLARAQDNWPTRPITLIVPWAPGGSNDVVARLVAPQLQERLGQSVVVENRAGGGGSIGMGQIVRARPDGYNLLVSSASNHVFHALVSPDLGYDVRDALTGIAMMVDVPNVLAVHPGLGVSNVQELLAKIRATRGGMSFGSSGTASSNHLAGELFRMMSNTEMVHVPYRGGGPVANDLIAGTIPMAFMNLPTVVGPAEGGRVRIIGVGTAERVRIRPDLPTIAEQGMPGYAVRSWTGLFAPRGTPGPVIDRLAQAMKEALESETVKSRLTSLASEPIWMDPAATDAFVRAEFDRWGPVVRAANVTTG